MIKKLLIKDYQNTENIQVRNRYGVVAGIFGILSNIILFIIKIIVGLISNSITIIADALNNLSDFGSSIITLVGFKLTNKPADKEHPYGHARYEYIAGIIISILILSMGVLFTKTSIEKIIMPEEIVINVSTYIVLIIAIIIKGFQMFVYLDFAKEINSGTLKANAIDSRNDIITTTAVLLAVLIMGIFQINIDGYMAFFISIFIIISAIKMLKETIDPLLGIVPDEQKINQIKEKLLKHEEIKGIHDLLIHNYGVGNDFATVHVEISSNMNILTADKLIDKIEKEFKKDLGINLTIHIDPMELEDEETKILKKKVEKILNDFDDTLQIHDFKKVVGNKKTTVIFDIIVPFEEEYVEEEIINILTNKFQNENTEYKFVITLDRPFG